MANDPPIKARLESKLFTNNAKDVQKKLDDCLAIDPLHIAPGQSGEHVKRIQQALDTLRKGGMPIPAIVDPAGRYLGTAAEIPAPQKGTTAFAVLEYKKLKGIRVTGRPFDAIVGRRTITQLDDDLSGKDPKPAPPQPPAPVTTPILDVIIHYRGVLGSASEMRPNAVFPNEMLDSANYPPSGSTRELLRIGHFTTTIRQDSAGLLDRHERTITDALKGKTPGLIFIYGSSSGGRNALDMAIRLTGKQLPLDMVAPIDAAFFPNEAQNAPSSRFGRPETPMFDAGGVITARDKKNFIQQVGNHAEFSFSEKRLVYSSSMKFKEVHGDIPGFTRVDRSDIVASAGSDDDAHVDFSNFARDSVQATIRGILRKLSPAVIPVPPVFVPAFQL